MQLEMRSFPFPLTPGLQARVRRRLQFALHRFQGGIGRVRVRLRDLNGPRGGVDKQVLMEARLSGGQKCLIEDTDQDLGAAIDRACDRLGRLLGRLQTRRLNRRRAPPRATWMARSRSGWKRKGARR